MRKLCLLSAGLMLFPLSAGAQSAVNPVVLTSEDAIPVSLELYDRDKLTKAFADSFRATIEADSRFTVAKDVPAGGLKIKMTDSLKPMENDSASIAGYEVSLKLGSGKYVGDLKGYCDQARLEMCGRVVAEDAYKAFSEYTAKHKPKS